MGAWLVSAWLVSAWLPVAVVAVSVLGRGVCAHEPPSFVWVRGQLQTTSAHRAVHDKDVSPPCLPRTSRPPVAGLSTAAAVSFLRGLALAAHQHGSERHCQAHATVGRGRRGACSSAATFAARFGPRLLKLDQPRCPLANDDDHPNPPVLRLAVVATGRLRGASCQTSPRPLARAPFHSPQAGRRKGRQDPSLVYHGQRQQETSAKSSPGGCAPSPGPHAHAARRPFSHDFSSPGPLHGCGFACAVGPSCFGRPVQLGSCASCRRGVAWDSLCADHGRCQQVPAAGSFVTVCRGWPCCGRYVRPGMSQLGVGCGECVGRGGLSESECLPACLV